MISLKERAFVLKARLVIIKRIVNHIKLTQFLNNLNVIMIT